MTPLPRRMERRDGLLSIYVDSRQRRILDLRGPVRSLRRRSWRHRAIPFGITPLEIDR